MAATAMVLRMSQSQGLTCQSGPCGQDRLLPRLAVQKAVEVSGALRPVTEKLG